MRMCAGIGRSGGGEYRATMETTGISPPDAPWELFLSAGDPGKPGPANTLSIGTVETLPAGSQATAEITGDAPNQTLSLAIPQGADGPANTLTIGEVTTLEPGEPASATITGDAPNQVLNLSIPQGEQGAAGSGVIPDEWDSPSAYVFAYHTVAASDAGRKPGEEMPASDLYVGEIHFEDAAGVKTSGPSYQLHPSGGTWRLQGSMLQGIESTTVQSCLIFLRIDGMTASMQPSAMLLKSTSAESVRNCQYSSADGQTIDCEVEANGKWHPFTAAAADVTEWGRAIYAAAVAGIFGDVAGYSE